MKVMIVAQSNMRKEGDENFGLGMHATGVGEYFINIRRMV
jgi:hypothetical protein